jgi:alanine dehydrogenase
MIRIVTRRELAPLLRDDDELLCLMDQIERGLLDHHAGERGHVIFTNLPLSDPPNSAMLQGSVGPSGPLTLRVFPSVVNTVPRDDASLFMVFSHETGALECIMASDELNTWRTAIPAALGARHLTVDGASILGILGSGEQARLHARAIACACPSLSEVLVWSPTRDNRERFAREHTELLGMPVRAVDTAEEAVALADVVTAAGRTQGGVAAFDASWVKPGALIISMTNAAPRELLEEGQLVVATTNIPEKVAMGFASGIGPRAANAPEGVVQLADVIAGNASPRAFADQIVVWELAQVYLWDLPVADWAYGWVTRNEIGTDVALSD